MRDCEGLARGFWRLIYARRKLLKSLGVRKRAKILIFAHSPDWGDIAAAVLIFLKLEYAARRSMGGIDAGEP